MGPSPLNSFSIMLRQGCGATQQHTLGDGARAAKGKEIRSILRSRDASGRNPALTVRFGCTLGLDQTSRSNPSHRARRGEAVADKISAVARSISEVEGSLRTGQELADNSGSRLGVEVALVILGVSGRGISATS